MLSNSTFLITGGTGSFGNTLVSHLLNTDVSEIRIFSRDESKQHYMRQTIRDNRVRFFLGDVRNIMRDLDTGKNGINAVSAVKKINSLLFFTYSITRK